MIQKKNKRLKIFVVEGTMNMGGMICDVLLDLGIEAWTNPQRGYMDADVIIFPAGPAGLDLIIDWQVPPKPETILILWLVDPFPPPDMSPREEMLGRWIAKLNWRVLLSKKWADIVKKWIPFGRDIMRLASWFCIRKLRKEITRNGKLNYLDCADREWARVMQRHYMLKHHMQEGRIDYLFATTTAKQELLSRHGYAVDFVPFGYHSSLGENLGLDRDIDVLFLGRTHTRRRASMLSNLRKELGDKGVEITVVDRDCYGKERIELLNRTKISLDIPRVPWDFGPERFLLSMSCGALVVSEGLEPRKPYTHDENFIQSRVSDLAETICTYLKDEQARQRITDNAYEFITTQVSLTRSVSIILEKCNLVDF